MGLASEKRDIILLSPTGSGKTLAFILPLLKMLRPSTGRVQAVLIAPSRELVMQIYGVLRSIGAGIKVTPLYGGHSFEDESNSLKAGTDVVVATPGRLLDHIRRRTVDLLPVRILVLDEFDKSLELGFEEEMRKIVNRLKNVSREILTSATYADILPKFLNLNNLLILDYLGGNRELRKRTRVHRVVADSRDKLESLRVLIDNIEVMSGSGERMMLFVNHRESAERVMAFLREAGYPAVLYHGGLDQRDRETAVALFNNGSRPILVATDLAARGLDIRDVRAVIHYHQPLTPEAYTHRNGRTARVHEEGDIYVLCGPDEQLKEYIVADDEFKLDPALSPQRGSMTQTLCFGAGRKEKLSKGDILGFLVKQCGLEAGEIGMIDVRDHYALVAVNHADIRKVLEITRASKIKGERRRITLLD